MTDQESGVCYIKKEFVCPDQIRELSLEFVSEKDKRKLETDKDGATDQTSKKRRLSRKDKKLSGQNKSRGPSYTSNKKLELCNSVVFVNVDDTVRKCERKNCEFMHDVQEYLKNKPKDIDDSCYNFQVTGKCNRGITCRFGKEHITSEGENIIDGEKLELFTSSGIQTKNQLKKDLQIALRKRSYNFDKSAALIQFNDKKHNVKIQAHREGNSSEGISKVKLCGSVSDEDIIKLQQAEKKKINWQDKLVLSPLTTVGNLPFRRICKEFGADITCGEMAMCSSVLQGAPQEWALLKRHHSEDIFGIQLCANNPHLLTRCGQVLDQEIEIDFVDLNLGCPIELVFKEGAGCGLLRRPRVLESCIRNLSQILSVPLTVKMRTGVYKNENIAHKLVPHFGEWGASLVTIHGRSREQRYTKSADWKYIGEVAKAAAPLPVLGNGDVISWEDYKQARDLCPELTGVMIGRGALLKPWIFTEIKEQKIYDISSSERFDILKKYTNYGLEHWGSDNKGVENTRRFLLEWLSFLYRYVPVGLLERPPQKINDRPPTYKGRDDMETLMASSSAADWIKISEMLLGPVPEHFHFLPKHKANAYK